MTSAEAEQRRDREPHLCISGHRSSGKTSQSTTRFHPRVRLLCSVHSIQPPSSCCCQPWGAPKPHSSSSTRPPPPPSTRPDIASSWFGPAPNTLTEPVWDIVKRDISRIVSNLKLVVFPSPYRQDPGKALRDWGLWGPFFFIVFLGLTLSWSASVQMASRRKSLTERIKGSSVCVKKFE